MMFQTAHDQPSLTVHLKIDYEGVTYWARS